MKRLLILFFCLFILSNTNAQWFWQNPLPQGNPLPSIYFADMNIGWAVGSGGTIIKTTDGGDSWESQYNGISEILLSVHFNDSNTGWVVGYNGLILKTTNSGVGWESRTSGTNSSLSSVCFTGSNTGWAVGENGTILYTTNAGTTWESQTSGTSEWLNSVYFIDSNNGWTVGKSGIILYTTNAGTTWESRTSEWFNSVYFIDLNTDWAVGAGGTIISTYGEVSSLEEQHSTNPQEFTLYQNYPNPFNPNTKIVYKIQKPAFISLKVYDALVSEIITLVNEEKPAGSYEVEFDGAGLPSGIYFYRKQTGDFIETKKMVLIK